MQVITEKSTGRVVFALPDDAAVRITDAGLVGSIRAPGVTADTFEHLQGVPPNADYVPGHWCYGADGWQVLDADAWAQYVATRDAQAAKDAVPASVTMRQARLALLGAGLLDDIDAAINALPSPQKEAARIEWEYSQEVQRHNGFVSVLAPALGLTEAQTDALFVGAALL